jgi:hypothetical protein
MRDPRQEAHAGGQSLVDAGRVDHRSAPHSFDQVVARERRRYFEVEHLRLVVCVLLRVSSTTGSHSVRPCTTFPYEDLRRWRRRALRRMRRMQLRAHNIRRNTQHLHAAEKANLEQAVLNKPVL